MSAVTVHIDVAELVARFAHALRHAGIPASPDSATRFARALGVLPPADRTSLYWSSRVTFGVSAEHVAAFDAVFETVFAGGADIAGAVRNPDAPKDLAAPQPPRPFSSTPPSGVRESGGTVALPESGLPGERVDAGDTSRALATSDEVLAHKDFAALNDDELAALRRLLDALAVATPVRQTRRTRVNPRGRRVDLRRTLRRSHHTAGDIVHLARRRRRERRRRLVLLCDVSGSMEPYTRAYLQFLGCAAAGASAEAFVFATRLTHLTRALRQGTLDEALRRAGLRAPDWAGGTRIGESLAAFNDSFGRRGMARGAVVVIVSDGWEREAPDVVAREMERLARLAYRIVWVNPRKALPGYAPLVAGMAAALPHCDAFVSGHSLAALQEVVAAIAERPHVARHSTFIRKPTVHDQVETAVDLRTPTDPDNTFPGAAAAPMEETA